MSQYPGHQRCQTMQYSACDRNVQSVLNYILLLYSCHSVFSSIFCWSCTFFSYRSAECDDSVCAGVGVPGGSGWGLLQELPCHQPTDTLPNTPQDTAGLFKIMKELTEPWDELGRGDLISK